MRYTVDVFMKPKEASIKLNSYEKIKVYSFLDNHKYPKVTLYFTERDDLVTVIQQLTQLLLMEENTDKIIEQTVDL